LIRINLFWRLILILGLIAPAVFWGLTGAAAQTDIDDPSQVELPSDTALPDLQTLPITDLRLQVDTNTGERALRFSNSIVNAGEGPLELHGEYDEQADTIIVFQHIYSGDEVVIEPLEGTFYFSGEHLHWHWEDFIAYEIWTVETGGDLSRKVLSNDKVGFCLYDTHPIGSDWIEQHMTGKLERAPRAVYTTCRFGRQGLSVGWVDVYEHHLPGQALDISDLDDGIYALRSVANQDGVLHELNYENNDMVLYFALHEDQLIILSEEFSLMDYFGRLVEEGQIEIIDGKVVEESEGDVSTGEE
jgi:hypothetical protein